MKQNYFEWEVPLLSCEQEKFPWQPQDHEIWSHIPLGSGHKPAVKLHVQSVCHVWLTFHPAAEGSNGGTASPAGVARNFRHQVRLYNGD